MISNFTIFLCLTYLFLIFFLQIKQIFIFSFDSCCSVVNNLMLFFLKLIISIVCSLKDSQKFFMQSSLLHTSCLFSMLFNDDIVDIEKPEGICSPTFVRDEFSGKVLHPSIFSIKHSRSA